MFKKEVNKIRYRRTTSVIFQMNTKLDSLKCLLHDIKVKLVLWQFSFELIGVKKNVTGVVTTKCEQRSVIRFFFFHLKDKNPVIIYQELKDVYRFSLIFTLEEPFSRENIQR